MGNNLRPIVQMIMALSLVIAVEDQKRKVFFLINERRAGNADSRVKCQITSLSTESRDFVKTGNTGFF